MDKKTNRIRESSGNREDFFRTVFAGSFTGFYRATSDGAIIEANQTAINLLEQIPANQSEDIEHISNHWVPLFLRKEYRDELHSGKTLQRVESQKKDKTGKMLFLRESCRAVQDEQGAVLYYEGVIEDVTAVKNIEVEQIGSELKEKNRFLETLLNNLPGVVYRCKNDRKWTMEYLAGSVREVTGYDPEDIIGNKKLSYNDLIVEEYRDKVYEDWQKAVENKGTYEGEYKIQTARGERKWVLGKGVGIYSADGELISIEGIINDITKCRESELNLYDKTKQLESFFKLVPDYLLITDKEYRMIKMSRSWEKLLGYPAEVLERKLFTDFIHPDDVAATKEVINQLVEHSYHNNSVNRYKTKDGSYRYLEWFSQYSDGLIYAIARDISDKVQDEELMKELLSASESFLLKTALDIDYKDITDIMRRITGAFLVAFNLYEGSKKDFRTVAISGMNEKVQQGIALLGFNPEKKLWIHDKRRAELIAGNTITHFSSLSEVTGKIIPKAMVVKLEQLFNLGDTLIVKIMKDNYVYGDFTVLMSKDVKVKNETILNVYARQIGLLLSRINAEKALLEKEEELKQAFKMEAIGRLAGGIAHDFNNMLHAILGYSDLSLSLLEPKQDRVRQYLKEIINAAKNSAELTKQLLAFARKQTIAPVKLSLNETVDSMMGMFRHVVDESIDLIWLPYDEELNMVIDPNQLQLILLNLIINSKDALELRNEGEIIIMSDRRLLEDFRVPGETTQVSGEYCSISVTDNGSGIEEKLIEHIFEPFFTTKGMGKGTGLGLSTVYGITKQNEGFIIVDSELGKGTAFTVFFPTVTVQETKKKTKGKEMTDINQQRKETVLLVEDDEVLLQLVKEMLTILGCNVMAYSNPDTALSIVNNNEEHFDLLITDIVMPKINGKELYEKISAKEPGLKCLFMSGYTADVIEGFTLKQEKNIHFIPKPFSLIQLQEMMVKIFE